MPAREKSIAEKEIIILIYMQKRTFDVAKTRLCKNFARLCAGPTIIGLPPPPLRRICLFLSPGLTAAAGRDMREPRRSVVVVGRCLISSKWWKNQSSLPVQMIVRKREGGSFLAFSGWTPWGTEGEEENLGGRGANKWRPPPLSLVFGCR